MAKFRGDRMLQNRQGLLTHMTSGQGSPQQYSDNENYLQIDPIFNV